MTDAAKGSSRAAVVGRARGRGPSGPGSSNGSPLVDTAPKPLAPRRPEQGVRFVAEVCSNHSADLERSLSFVDRAAEIGCSGVKFQQFRVDSLFCPEALARNASLAERREWELPEEFNEPLARRAHELGLTFASTPFYLDAVPLLAPLVDYFKISSYQVLWHELLDAAGRTGKPIALSTGMATLKEVRAAVDVLWNAGCRDLTLMHCVSVYPTRPERANLAAIGGLREVFGCQVGWSDHTVDPEVVLRSVHRWKADMVEFHLDLDGEGNEFGMGHCWLPAAAGRVIAKSGAPRRCGDMSPVDGMGDIGPQAGELIERDWRTDPSDGLRPLRELRESWTD